jgi:hypothetical protein
MPPKSQSIIFSMPYNIYKSIKGYVYEAYFVFLSMFYNPNLKTIYQTYAPRINKLSSRRQKSVKQYFTNSNLYYKPISTMIDCEKKTA